MTFLALLCFVAGVACIAFAAGLRYSARHWAPKVLALCKHIDRLNAELAREQPMPQIVAVRVLHGVHEIPIDLDGRRS